MLDTWQSYGRPEGRKWSARRTFLLLFRNESRNLAAVIRNKWTIPVSHCTWITSLHCLQHKGTLKRQPTAQQIVLPFSQHPFVGMLAETEPNATEWFSCTKRSTKIDIAPRKTSLNSHLRASGILRSVYNTGKANFPFTPRRKPKATYILAC